MMSSTNGSDTRKQTILITGATSGIGRHAALHLAERGHRVFATGRREEALRELAEASPNIETLRLDVTDAASIAAAREEIERLTGGEGVDVLVNNAGYGHVGPVEAVSLDDLRAQYETNVFGVVAMIKAFVPGMRARGRGRILNVSSVGGRMTIPLMGIYNSSKYALESLSDALRAELHPFGIDVVLIEPGPIKTAFGDRSMGMLDRYREQSSPYAGLFDRAEEVKGRFDRMSAGPRVISRAITRAIESRRPRPRYVAPFSSRMTLGLAKAMPTRAVDWMFRQALGLTPKHLLPSTGQTTAASRV